MMRLIALIVIAGLIGAGAVWLVDNDGTATIVMAGYELEMRASTATFAMFLLAAVLALTIWLALFLLESPARLAAWSSQRHARKFFEALSRGFIAAASSEAADAGEAARRAAKLMPVHPLSLLLQAQAAELTGEVSWQETTYRSMLGSADMELLGLRGLFNLAMRRHDGQAALFYATRAYALKPGAWALNALFGLRVSRREWREAQGLVMQAVRGQILSSQEARRRRAVLLAAQAADAERAGEAAAFDHAQEALALAPGLTVPALIAARHLTAQGRTTRARNVIEAAWAEAPHRDLAPALSAIFPTDTAEVRAKRLTALAKHKPTHPESRVLMAEQSVLLKRWNEARHILAPIADEHASARVCSLMAEIASNEKDEASAQVWRGRASRGGPVAAWRCTGCGGIAPAWEPACPVCGAFDSLSWGTAGTTAVPEPPPARVPINLPEKLEPPQGSGVEPVQVEKADPVIRLDEPERPFIRPDDPGPGESDIFGQSEERPAVTMGSLRL